MNFWQKLDKPFFILAPMANVTDWAFRQIVVACGKPDIFYTEFISCDGVAYDKTKFEKELYFEKNERPIVVQFFGSKPENFYKCARLAVELGFDGIDINMGCPDRSVEKQGAGAALIKNHKLAQKIIKETKRGASLSNSKQTNLPISVKTRIGYDKINTKEWISVLLEAEPTTIAIHGRTRKEMSSVPAHWDEIGLASKIAKNTNTLIAGNGDVLDLSDARQKTKDYELDGIMIGRGIFTNPWFFNEKINQENIKPEQRIDLLVRHIDLFHKLWGSNKNFNTMKKFFKVYINNWPGAKELRTKLMATKSKEQILSIIENSNLY